MEVVPRQVSKNKTFENHITKVLLCFIILHLTIIDLYSQVSLFQIDGTDLYPRYISALFLTISLDARSAGMGDVGVASDPDINSQHWNSAKYAFIEGKGGISLSYTPWLRNVMSQMNTDLLSGMNISYLTGYYRINKKNTVSGSFRYFSWGIIQPSQAGIMDIHDRFEFGVDAGYSRLFTDHLSGGIVIRYIHSDLVGDAYHTNVFEPKPGESVAGDIGLYYHNAVILGEKESNWAVGLNISNIGTPMSYDEDKVPIPTNLRVGGRFRINFNETNSLSFHLDINKLLVPTKPEYGIDTLTDDIIILHGKELPESVPRGMVQSFYDAPGYVSADGTRSVFLEELHEVQFNLGIEYLLRKKFAVRTGFFHEHATKGNRQYFTVGAGAKVKFLSFDVSYLLPFDGQNSPLFNTFRFTLSAEFGSSSV